MSTLFNLYDYIFFAFILFFAFIGLARGFWVQLIATFVWAIGAVFYYFYGASFEQGYLSQHLSLPIAHWFTLAIVIVGCFFVNFLIRFLLGSIFKLNAFTFFNKVFGFVFGACASTLIVLLMIYAINHSSLSTESTDWKKSYVVTQVSPEIESFKFKDPHDIKNSFATSNSTVSQLGNTAEVA